MEKLSQQLSDLFGLIYRNLIREEGEAVVLSSNSQDAVLAVLYRKGPLPMNIISEHLRVTKGNMTFLVDKLEKAKLIRRERSAEDRRIILIELTEKGARSIRDKHTHRINKIGSHLKKLNTGEIEELDIAVQTVIRILRKI